ncbi:MAG: ABC transporter ATP-binding protein/permease [Methylocella sp.]|jgi:vitamin B12/bleomycin/antimicrobial peptide transport system ATP-binding/permease protein
MNQEQVPFDKLTVVRFIGAVRLFAKSEYGRQAKLMFVGLIALLLGINGTNVLNSYVGRDFMTAIEHRNKAEFIQEAVFYIGVFAASTIVAVVSRFTEERLGLLWREFLTRKVINIYLAQGTYYRLQTVEGLANPDQRIAEDVRAFTVTTLSFVLMLLNSAFTVVAFSGVLWLINPLLFGVAVLYAACGTYVTLVLGRPLIKLNYDQLDKEANFRSALIHVRENAESILLARREDRLKARLLSQLENFVANFRKITSVNRNVGFFTTGYNWLIQIIPALIVAPSFIAGQIEFGVITQSAMAFTLIVNAFSLIITQVQSLSNFAAVVDRLNSLVEALERTPPAEGAGIQMSEEDRRVAYEEVTLLSPVEGQPVLKDLSISIPFGSRVLISGSNETGKLTLFRATAGLWPSGKGRIIRPAATDIYFLAERPYLPPGTLREVLVDQKLEHSIADGQIRDLLHELDLDPVLVRAGGLNIEKDWGTLLSLGEQQLLAFVHILLAAPNFVFLDRAGTALNPGQLRKILKMLSKNSITYINIGESDDLRDLYDAVLEIDELGTWRWRQISAEPAN